MKHKGTEKLETKRLILRRFVLEDSYFVFNNWQSKKEVVKFLTWTPYETEQEVRKNLHIWIEGYNNLNFYNWAIVLKSLNEPIGNIAVVAINEKCFSFEVGFVIGKLWWGCGFVVEAFKKVISFLFEEVKAKRIEAKCQKENINSKKVIEKCGLKQEGILRKAAFNNQGIVDILSFSILDFEYFNK